MGYDANQVPAVNNAVYYPSLGYIQQQQLYQLQLQQFYGPQQAAPPNAPPGYAQQQGYWEACYRNWQGSLGGPQCRCCCCRGPQWPPQPKRIEEDKFGVGESGQGARSNLANSPEAVLAINDILKKHGGNMAPDALAKELKEKYGIECEVGDIKTVNKDGKETTVKGIKFANGDFLVDSNGDNQLGNGDYKFNDAIKAMKEKYGIDDKFIEDYLKGWEGGAKAVKSGGQYGNYGPYGGGYGGFNPNQFPGYQNLFGTNQFPPNNNFGGQQNGNMNWIMIILLFLLAGQFARPY